MKTYQELQEGLQDPNIFKAFFLAGGPGSGKSYVVRKTTGGTGLRVVNSDDAFEALLKKAGLSMKMPEDETAARDVVRGRAKEITAKRHKNYVKDRIGLVIDGTGREYDKIRGQKAELESLGYDTYMIFVNTSMDTALERNAMRDRTVREDIVIKSWKDVQGNIGKFNALFRKGMIIVDNNDANEDILFQVYKRVKGLLRKKITNTRAKNWMAMELAKKQRK